MSRNFAFEELARGTQRKTLSMSTSPSPSRQNVSFGLAPESHLGGGVVVVVRDPQQREANLIILSHEAVNAATNDALYLTAKRLLALDTATEPALAQRRVITLFADMKVRLQVGKTVQWARLAFSAANISNVAMPEMRRREATSREIQVDGIGPVKLAFDADNPSG